MGCVPTTRRINTKPIRPTSTRNSVVEPKVVNVETGNMSVGEYVPQIITVPSTTAHMVNAAPSVSYPTQVVLQSSTVTGQPMTLEQIRGTMAPPQMVMHPQSVQKTLIPNSETMPAIMQHHSLQVQQMAPQSLKQSQLVSMSPMGQSTMAQSHMPVGMNGASTRLTGGSIYQQSEQSLPPSVPSFPQTSQQQPYRPMNVSFIPNQQSPPAMQQSFMPQQRNDDLLRQLNMECADVNEQNFQEIRVEKMEFGMKAY